MFLGGIALAIGVWFLVPAPWCIIPRLCGGFVISYSLGYGVTKEIYLNWPGWMSLIFFSAWIVGVPGGILAAIASLLPTKYEIKDCPHCGIQTEQFRSGGKYKEGFKPKFSNLSEWKANLVGHEYVCEKCRKKHLVPIG
jgi:hypothetical protein